MSPARPRLHLQFESARLYHAMRPDEELSGAFDRQRRELNRDTIVAIGGVPDPGHAQVFGEMWGENLPFSIYVGYQIPRPMEEATDPW